MWTAQKEKFSLGLLAGWTQTDAYRNAYDCSNCTPKTVWDLSSKLARDTEVRAWVTERKQKALDRFDITQADILREMWQVATADPNELTQIRRNCCRHCWGWNFGYQWKTEEEWANACARAIGSKTVPPEFDGGDGFDKRLDPNADCPECEGDGVAEVVMADTRKLKGSARRLFAGVKQTKFGVEVMMRDQDGALDKLARHLGMYNDKLHLPGMNGAAPTIPDKASIEGADETTLSKVYRDLMG